MLLEIRKITNRSKANYIRKMQYNGFINIYFNSDGYICYKQEEIDEYQRNNKRGRPSNYFKFRNQKITK